MGSLASDPGTWGRCDRPGSMRVAIVGGGITGLAAAHRLRELAPGLGVVVLEAETRPGGVLRTSRRDGFLIESAADGVLTAEPAAVELCRRLGIEDRLVRPSGGHRRAFVVRDGRRLPIPDGLTRMAPGRLWPVLTSPILSLRGKLRLACEPFVRRGAGADESLASFATRRFGREAFERLIQPLMAGIYAGEPERLSLAATMPQLLEMERSHGSVARAVRRSAGSQSGERGGGARYGLFAAPRGGMGELVGALVDRLPAGTVRCGVAVERMERAVEGGWRLHLGGVEGETLDADAVIVATPARNAAGLVRGIDPELGAVLGEIESAACAVVALGYRREQVAHPLDGFGLVVPRPERSAILSASFASVKFPGRAPDGSVLFRVFLGGEALARLLGREDKALIATAEGELGRLLGIAGRPVIAEVSRWAAVMPRYHVGHLERVERIEARVARHRGLELAGNAYRGVGVPRCIRDGERAAERVASILAGRKAKAAEVIG